MISRSVVKICVSACTSLVSQFGNFLSYLSFSLQSMFLMELFSLYFLSFCGRTTLILRSFVILYLWQVLVKLGNMTMYISALLLCAFSVFYGISCQFNILGSKLTVFLVIDRNIIPIRKNCFSKY